MTAVSSRPTIGVTRSMARSPLLRQLAAITAAGLLLGFLVGGVGGRLAMRALFLTSTAVRGVVSDDGFPIGEFTATGTLNLLLATTGIGVIGTFVYAAVRPFLLGPTWLRSIACGIGAGAVIGALLVSTQGVDFTLLGPRWFAIALFVGLPALFGILAVPVVERALAENSWFHRAPAPLALAPLIVFAFPPLLVLVGLPALAVTAAHHWVSRSPAWSARLRHPAVLWGVRVALVAMALAGVAGVVRDAMNLL